MSGPMFVRLRENNENEGEIYHYWLQLTGNEEAISELEEALSSDSEMFENFTLRMDVERSEEEVDLLVEECEEGYMALVQKFTGRLEWPTDQMSVDDWMDAIYKGSIEDYFTEEDDE